MQNHNDDTIKTSDTVLRKIYLSLYLKGLCVRVSWRPKRTATYWTPSAFHSNSPGLFNWGPGGPASLGHVPQSSILSLTPLIPSCNCSIGGLRTHSAWCWLSLPHLSNSSGLQTAWLPVLTELYNSSTSTFFWRVWQFRTHSPYSRSML